MFKRHPKHPRPRMIDFSLLTLNSGTFHVREALTIRWAHNDYEPREPGTARHVSFESFKSFGLDQNFRPNPPASIGKLAFNILSGSIPGSSRIA